MEGQYLLLLLSIILMTTAIVIFILMKNIKTIFITTTSTFCRLYSFHTPPGVIICLLLWKPVSLQKIFTQNPKKIIPKPQRGHQGDHSGCRLFTSNFQKKFPKISTTIIWRDHVFNYGLHNRPVIFFLKIMSPSSQILGHS